MAERTAILEEFNAETSRILFLKRKKLSKFPGSNANRRIVRVGDLLNLTEFGLVSVWQGQSDVLVTLRPEQDILYRTENAKKPQRLKAKEQDQFPLPSEGLRIINPQTKRQISVILSDSKGHNTEDLPIGAKPKGPDPTLSASVSLKEPRQ